MDNSGEIKISVSALEIISKLKSKIDRQNFCREMNWFCPDEPGYDSNYFLKVLMGEKRYLPINFNTGYKLKYFKKGITLNKKYIISKMLGNYKYALYTPDTVNVEKLSRNFLLTLVAYIDPDLYKSFYSIYKEQISARRYNKWIDYTIDVQSSVLSKIKEYIPTDNNSSGNKSFKLSKNHAPNYTFKKSEGIGTNLNNNSNINDSQSNLKENVKISINPKPKDILNKYTKEKKKGANLNTQTKLGDNDVDMAQNS